MKMKDGITLNEITDLRRFGNTLLGLPNVELVVEKAFTKIRERIFPQVVSLFLFSKDGFIERYKIIGADREGHPIADSWLHGEKYKPGESFSGKAAQAKEQPYGEPYWSSSLNVEIDKLSHGKDYAEKLGFLRCGISVPLNGTHRTFGTLEVINRVNPEDEKPSHNLTFSDSDICWLTSVGSHVAAAISRLRKKDEDKIFSSMIHVLADPELEDPLVHSAKESVYHLIAESLVNELMPYKVCIVRLVLDGESLIVTDKAHSNGDNNGWKYRVDESRFPGQGLVGKVLETGQFEIIKNIEEEENRIIDKEWVRAQNLKSFICFPLLTLGRVIGTLSLFTGYVYEFNDSDIEFLRNVSSLLAAFKVRSEKVKRIDSFGSNPRKAKDVDLTGNKSDEEVLRLLRSLSNESAKVRAEAALSLGAVGDEIAVPNLCHVLTTDEQPEVRRSAAQALGMLGSYEAEIETRG